MAWFRREQAPLSKHPAVESRVPEGLWSKCENCKEILYRKDVIKNLSVCPKCAFHFRLSARERLELFFDGPWEEFDVGLVSADQRFTVPLGDDPRLRGGEKREIGGADGGPQTTVFIGNGHSFNRPSTGVDGQTHRPRELTKTCVTRLELARRLVIRIEGARPDSWQRLREIETNAQQRERVQTRIEVIQILTEAGRIAFQRLGQLAGLKGRSLRGDAGLCGKRIAPASLAVSCFQGVRLRAIPGAG